MISSTVLVQLIEGLCLKRIAYRSCSKEWAFLGFHRISDIQFFWRWNISPSSLLADRKMSTKSKIVRQVFPKEADMLIFHVTWWKIGVLLHDVRCISLYRDSFGSSAARIVFRFFFHFYRYLLEDYNVPVCWSPQTVRRDREGSWNQSHRRNVFPCKGLSLLRMAHLIHYLLRVISF